MGGQHLSPVREAGADIQPSILIEHDGADFGIPEDFQPLTLSIVGNTREVEGLTVVSVSPDVLDQPRTASQFNKASRFDCRPSCTLHYSSRVLVFSASQSSARQPPSNGHTFRSQVQLHLQVERKPSAMATSWARPAVLMGLGDPPCCGTYRPPPTYVGYQFAVVNNGPGLALTDVHPDRVQQRLHP